jgi:hypothetical protein
MSLKPRKVDFAHSWQQLQVIIDGIVKCQGVNRQVWNEMFSYLFCYVKLKMYNFCLL